MTPSHLEGKKSPQLNLEGWAVVLSGTRDRPRDLCWRLEETAGLFPRVELPRPREPCLVPTWLFVTPQVTGSIPLPLGVSQAEPASAFLPGSCSIPHYLSWGLKVEWGHLGLRKKQDRGLDWRAKD